MKSAWYEYKQEAHYLREHGLSIGYIEKKLGIPRSTLSGWFKSVVLTPEQQANLKRRSVEALRAHQQLGRGKASVWHREQKELRLLAAKQEALEILDRIELSDSILDLAFAMLYLGEGAKADKTSIASSDPKILRFVLVVLKKNYAITPDMLRCNLHLRMDQDEFKLKSYWSDAIGVPLENFKYTAFDKRTAGKPTSDRYKGVCVLEYGNIAIQRKLMYLYNLFCEKVAEMDTGV